MRKYDFEYTDQKYLIKLFLFCFTLFGILCAIIFKIKLLGFFPSILIIMGIPILIFWLNKKKIKKQGHSVVHESNIEFNLNGVQKNINFNDIENYLVEVYNGTALKIKTNNGEKINIVANSSFCEPDKFDEFCINLEKNIETFNRENNTPIIRKKTFFEKTWILPFLLIMTVIVVVFIVYGLMNQNFKKPASLFMTIGSLFTLWGGYFSAKNRKK